MAERSYEERMQELKQKREQLMARERELTKRHNAEERKRRTRRLIEIGGITESVLGRPLTDQDKVRFMYFLKLQEQRGGFFSKAMNEDNVGGDANA